MLLIAQAFPLLVLVCSFLSFPFLSFPFLSFPFLSFPFLLAVNFFSCFLSLYAVFLSLSVTLSFLFAFHQKGDPEETSPEYFESLSFSILQDIVNISKKYNGVPDQDGNIQLTGRPTFSPAHEEIRLYLINKINSIISQATNGANYTLETSEESGVFQLTRQRAFVQTYSNITNIKVKVVPSEIPPSELPPFVVYSAHYDSVVFSPGASDNGVQVANALEVLRVLSHRPQLPFPILFLFDDAEEASNLIFSFLFFPLFFSLLLSSPLLFLVS